MPRRHCAILVLVGILALSLTLALGGVGFWLASRSRVSPTRADANPASPYLNLGADAKYVGDTACARCHPGEAAAYQTNPMSRSLVEVTRSTAIEKFDLKAGNPFSAGGFQFDVQWRGAQMIHRETRPASAAGPDTTFEGPIRFGIGSGTRARSYLIERDGFLFQSALTWYRQRAVWDLSPGFAQNPHSDRVITADCLFCHCTNAQAVPGTINRYRTPIFPHGSIGCERCHGPGSLHADRPEAVDSEGAIDYTIVNPGRMSPTLRDAVCEQCHLQGERRVLRRGRQVFDYRPGLTVQEFWAVFLRAEPGGERSKAVGQVEQMHSSRCFQASNGKLGCVTCHDAHGVPTPEMQATFYRERCLRCHAETACSLPVATRRERSPQDYCASCHMPRLPSGDVAHTAITDHRVLRQYPPSESPPSSTAGGAQPLVPFYPEPDATSNRDLGIAIARSAEFQTADRPAQRRLAEQALELLSENPISAAQDLPALQARGYALWLLDRRTEALAHFQQVLAEDPGREECLVYAAGVSAQLGQVRQAVAYWRQVLDLDPWSTRSHFELARLLARQQDWPSVLQECRTVLRLHPFHRPAQELLLLAEKQSSPRRN